MATDIRLNGTTDGALLSNLMGRPVEALVRRPCSLTLATDTLVCLSTLSGVDSYDTVLHVRTECDDSLSEVESPIAIGCNDDAEIAQ